MRQKYYGMNKKYDSCYNPFGSSCQYLILDKAHKYLVGPKCRSSKTAIICYFKRASISGGTLEVETGRSGVTNLYGKCLISTCTSALLARESTEKGTSKLFERR